jgi:sugar lactone lactonase YvrE
MPAPSSSRISTVRPLWAVEEARIVVTGSGFSVDPPVDVRIGPAAARVARATPSAVTALVPAGLDGGRTPVRIGSAPGETAYIEVGAPLATGLHQVDSPVFDRDGNLYVTFSGSRGQQAPVSIYLVRPNGAREPFVTGLANPTSLTLDSDGRLYVSSRFDGTVHRVDRTGLATVIATDLGVPTGIAWGPDGVLYVGDRSGSILRIGGGRASEFAAIPSSVAAFHLAFGPDACLYVSAPTLAPREGLFRVAPDGRVERLPAVFGRPQGLAFDDQGMLYVADALAGDGGLFRLDVGRPGEVERMVWRGGLIGVAFDPRGGLAIASSDTVYRLGSVRAH